jgi:YbgC/YbaW family acyl-CoA thioester hydrolase
VAFRFFSPLKRPIQSVIQVDLHLNYLSYGGYFDNGMGDYWRALALPYEAAMAQLGGDMFVKKASVEYHGSARYDDVLDVGLRCQRVGTSSVTFSGAIFRAEALLVGCELVYVYANPSTQKSIPVPELLRTLFQDFEAGQSITQTQTGSWADVGAQASSLRQAVFVEEQGIDAAIVWDSLDASAVHAVISNRMGQAVASGRLLQYAPGVGQIGRMAVSRALRGSHLGGDVLQALVDAACVRGDTEVLLHAQCSAQGFYSRHGFIARGAVFEEAGIRHITMAKRLITGS